MKGFINGKLRAAGIALLLWGTAVGTLPAEQQTGSPGGEVMASAAGREEKRMAESLPAKLSPWSVQGEYYWGTIHTREADKRFQDGCWAGIGAAFPSYAALQWQGADDRKANISVGLGELYNGSEASFNQPVEAYYETPLRSGTLTAGKFYAPFALQEWQYETRYGFMYGDSRARWDRSYALTYNPRTDRPNFYTRHGYQLGSAVSAGLSLAAGDGWTYDSGHRWAWGADLSAEVGLWALASEYLRADSRSGAFDFAFARLSYTGGKRVIPHVAVYRWKDRAEEFGTYHSAVVGVSYTVTSSMSLEGGYGSGSDKGKWWLQAHWRFGP